MSEKLQKARRMGSLKRKILILLQAGCALGLTSSPKKHWWILGQIPKELTREDKQGLERAIKSLYASHLVDVQHNKEITSLTLSKGGKLEALKYNLEDMQIHPQPKWDEKWRIVMFDIPEKSRKLRNALRFHFSKIGMIELQKSVLVHPYPCEKEIEFILEYYNAKKYVRFITAEKIDNELHLLKKFKMI